MPFKQRKFAGDRFSDHVALMTLFNQWSQARENGFEAEERFCTIKDVNMSTLRNWLFF